MKEEIQEQQPDTDLDLSKWFLKGGTALFFDTTGALSNLVGPVILQELNDAFADGVFLLWFKLDGIKYSKNTMWGGIAMKFIPVINILPYYTLMIIIMYYKAKAKKAISSVPGGGSIAKTIGNQGKK